MAKKKYKKSVGHFFYNGSSLGNQYSLFPQGTNSMNQYSLFPNGTGGWGLGNSGNSIQGSQLSLYPQGNDFKLNASGTSTKNKANGNNDESEGSGGNFMSKVGQNLGYIQMFDSLAQNLTVGIDANRKGVNNQPQVLVEGVLGGQSGSHLSNMWNTGAKTAEALNYVNQQNNVDFTGSSTEDLLAQHSGVGTMDRLNINTKGKELEDFAFDPISYVITRLSGKRKKASDRQNRINEAIDAVNTRQQTAYNDAVRNFENKVDRQIAMNYRAFGGPLNDFAVFGGGALGYDIAKDGAYTDQLKAQSKNSTSFTPIFNSSNYTFGNGGGIYIKPSKRGTFTSAAKSRGMGVQEFASKVLANKDEYSPAMVKKANFARNAARWHADGGVLMSDDFSNGVTMINEGGTHENNPHEGVQMGIAPDGLPNLVEEGEAIFNDYVFSNRLRVPEEVRNKYKLRGPKDMTFAEAFREAQKESEERPNDPISQDGLENIAMILARTQEAVRGYEKATNKKSNGGHLFSGLENPYEYQEIEPEVIEEDPQTQAAIDAFWKGVLGEDKWDNSRARKQYLRENDPYYTPKKKERNHLSDSNRINVLRLAEPFANAGAVFTDSLGITNKFVPTNIIPEYRATAFTPLGDYVPEAYFDINYAANQAAQQAAATKAAIMNTTAPNRYATLLAADYNAQVADGNLRRDAAMAAYDNLLKAATFNRATNQYNSGMAPRIALENEAQRLAYANAKLNEFKSNEDRSNASWGARAANIGNLAASIADIGREQDALNWRDMLIRSGAFGTLSEKPSTWSDAEWEAYQSALGATSAKGGKIRKRKKGLTY